jgi:hypothetical protein
VKEASKPYPIPPFEMRAVAFLDVLGFTSLIDSAQSTYEGMRDLQTLISLLGNHVRFDHQTVSKDVPVEVLPHYVFVLEHDKYNGLLVVAMKCIQIAQKLLDFGFLIRGAISVGPAYVDRANIFGRGYINAYEGEKKANHPRIVLTEETRKYYEEKVVFGEPIHGMGMFVNYEDDPIVDTLHPFYFPDADARGGIDKVYLDYELRIESKLKMFDHTCRARNKWEWMAHFYTNALKRHGIDNPKMGFKTLPEPDAVA